MFAPTLTLSLIRSINEEEYKRVEEQNQSYDSKEPILVRDTNEYAFYSQPIFTNSIRTSWRHFTVRKTNGKIFFTN